MKNMKNKFIKNNKQKIKVNPENCDIEFFRLIMWHLGITYPRHIFYRRLEMLTKKERNKVEKKIQNLLFEKIYKKYYDEIETINEIMSNRAEIEEDKKHS